MKQAITDIADAGFEGIEIMSWHVSVIDQIRSVWGTIQQFLEELKVHKLSLTAIYWYGNKLYIPERHDDIIKEATLAAAFLAKCGCSIFNVDTMVRGPLKKDDKIGEEVIADEYLIPIADCLNRIGRVTLEYGVRTVVHQHLNAVIENRAEINRLMELTDSKYVWLCPDSAQLYLAGVDPVQFVQDFANRIGFVHLKDGNNENWKMSPREWIHGTEWPIMESPEHQFIWERERHFVDLGTGQVDLRGFLRALHRAGYDGWIVVEDDGTLDPRKAAFDNRTYIKKMEREVWV